ncbi:unnamed protein product [Coffea canephora]|uniref:Aminotransferase-like plant mobile domain-containing protein n=1 Tax=Coffea canephora TaxID=49390 RepID=A0A068U709_COFCA|nr:unnamed protein product [Coffea canephora]
MYSLLLYGKFCNIVLCYVVLVQPCKLTVNKFKIIWWNMSSDNSLVIQLYWGGKIIYAGGSMFYDPPMPKKVMFLRERVGFNELIDKVYSIMGLDQNRHKISLIFRNCVQHGVFGAMPLVDDNGVDGMYFLKAKSGHATEIYVEVEELLGLRQCDNQTLPIASPHRDVQQAQRGRKRGSEHRIEKDCPSSSHMPTLETRDSNTNAATVLDAATNTDIELVDVDVDSEPEPEADDFGDNDHECDTSGQAGNSGEGATTDDHASPSVAPHLRSRSTLEPEPEADDFGDNDHEYDTSGQAGNSGEGATTHEHAGPSVAPHLRSRSTPPPHPGPIDPSVLYLQTHHRSTAVFHGAGDVLDVRRCDKKFFDIFRHSDPRVSHYIDIAGFGGVRRAGYLQVNHGLITALVERWRQETHTFHLPVMGEATVTLQDVEVLWGLPVDGLPVTLIHVKRSPLQRKHLVQEVLGFWPEDNCFREGRLKMSSMYARLGTQLPPDAPDEMVRQYARMCILILLGGLLFADSCGNVVSLNWLDYVRDLEAMSKYSWGSAVLACLYSRMCHASHVGQNTTGGPYLLLQLWAWERIPTIRPDVSLQRLTGDYPRGGRWSAERTGVDPPSQDVSYYREQLSLLRMDQFIWMPYPDDVLASLPEYCRRGARIWRARVPLIFWHIVEFYFPDRVLRQFGMKQNIPQSVDTDRGGLHQLGLAGFAGRNWAEFHSVWIGHWNDRANAEVSGESTHTFSPSNDYLSWYHRHTVLYITPPLRKHPQSGHVHYEASGQFEYLMDSMHRIAHQSLDGLQHDDPTHSFHPSLVMIADEAFGSMQYLRRFDRMIFEPTERQDSGASMSHNIPHQRSVGRLPSQTRASSRGSRRHEHGLRDEVK